VETHDQNPTTEGEHDPWARVNENFGELGEQLRATYHKVADGAGPTETEIRDALATLARVWDRVADSIGTALRDPEVRQRLKDAAGSLATAMGTTISELGSELRAANRAGAEEGRGE